MKKLISSMARKSLGLGLIAATLTLAGCALTPKAPEQAVRERAAAFWQARVAGDLKNAYALTPPSYRKLRTLVQYGSKFGQGASFLGAEVQNVACEPAKCIVQMKVDVRVLIPALTRLPAVSMGLTDTWLLEDGQWWRYEEL